jgi:hypothetical protein
MVVDETIVQALNRIADNQEELNDTLKDILGHYNKVVPVMKRNADRVEEEMEKQNEGSFFGQVSDVIRGTN